MISLVCRIRAFLFNLRKNSLNLRFIFNGAVAFTAFADAWPKAIETEIGAALCAIGHGKGL